VVTSDNPRSEDPLAIIEEVMVGVRETGVECVVEVDRRVAIEVAIRAAQPGDIVLLAGKGHEKTQTFAGGVLAFDDVAEAERVLLAMKAGVRA
jgi:UDP-N-acetylmuramoyl-L-alanyl-D-glutamate--2,6-diaminopimelate ligase